MARRKKNRKKLNVFVFPTPVASVIIIAAITGVSYLWLCSTVEALGSRIKALESERVALREQFQNEQLRWTRMRSPRNIEADLARFGIDMVWPRRDQIVRMQDMSLAQLDRQGEGQAAVMPHQYVSRGRTVRHE